MNNIVMAGVGGQGILSVASVICHAALEEGLWIKQAEVHGMSQRGGAVQSTLRISKTPIWSDLIPKGMGDLLVSAEPLESLRYFDVLHPQAVVVTSINPFLNISNYPSLEFLWTEMEKKKSVLPIDTARLATEAGNLLAQGMVLLGAISLFLPLRWEGIQRSVKTLWESKGLKVVETNLAAIDLGKKMAEFLQACSLEGCPFQTLKNFSEKIPLSELTPTKAKHWNSLLS